MTPEQGPALRGPASGRALQIIDNLALGGAQRLLATLAEEYPAEAPLQVLALKGGKAPFQAILQAAGADVVMLPDLKLWHPWSIPRLVRHLRARAEPAVHIHLTYATILGCIAAQLAGKRVVVSLHNAQTVAGHRLRTQILRWLETFCLRRLTDQVIFVGPNVESANRARIGRTPGTVLPNVIQAPQALDPADRTAIRSGLGADRDDVVVIATGRLSRQKDPLMLMRAFAAAQGQLERLRLWIVGDGPLRPEVEALAAELWPNEDQARLVVRFLGPRNDVQRLLSAADIYALSSQWEGLPVALLEAMAAGRGIVCTSVGDIPAFLPKDAGLQVEPGDAKGFADALLRLAKDPKLRTAQARRASEAARPYCEVAAWRKALEQIYADLA
jgi:glycosyltransferase involved in cell wall biosynthesis